jgi:hypothetical protein
MQVQRLPSGVGFSPPLRFGRKATAEELAVLEKMADGLPVNPKTCIVLEHGKHPIWNGFKRIFNGELFGDLFRLGGAIVSRTWRGVKANFSKAAEPLEPLVVFIWNQDPPKLMIRKAKEHILRTKETGEDRGIKVFALAAKSDETKALSMIFRITPGIRSKKEASPPDAGEA